MEVISQFDRLLVFMNLGKRIEEVTFCEKMLNPNCRESSLNLIIIKYMDKCLSRKYQNPCYCMFAELEKRLWFIQQKKKGKNWELLRLVFKVSFYVRSA